MKISSNFLAYTNKAWIRLVFFGVVITGGILIVDQPAAPMNQHFSTYDYLQPNFAYPSLPYDH